MQIKFGKSTILRAVLSAFILIAVFGVFIFSAQIYKNFISDDALISIRYADNFINGHGLCWNPGERPVEGYSNLLWILLVSFIGLFNHDLIGAARFAGFLCVFMMMGSICAEFLRGRSKNYFGLAITLSFVALSGTVAAWVYGSLEQSLNCALLALSLWAVFRFVDSGDKNFKNVVLSGVLMGLLALSRLDGILFAFIITGAVMLLETGKGAENLKNIKLLIIPAAAVALQAVFRLAYYGALIPNTALIKISPSMEHASVGLTYVMNGIISMKLFFIPAAAGALFMLFDSGARKKTVILLAVLISWLAYIVFIGGDIFPAYRHMMPAIIIGAFLIIGGFIKAWEAKPAAIINVPVIFITCLLCVLYGVTQPWEIQNFKAANETWERNAMEAGRVIGGAFEKERPVVAVTAAGSLPYASGLPAIDLFGLNDYELPRFYRPKTAGKGWIGHEQGSAAYVIKRMPDLISLYDSTAEMVHYAWWAELAAMPEFKNSYRLIYFYCPENKFTAKFWANIYSKKTGIRVLGNDVIIPVYFFSTASEPAMTGADKKIELKVNAGKSAGMKDITIPAGKYIFSSDTKGLKARISSPDGAVIASGPLPFSVRVMKGIEKVNVELINSTGTGIITGNVFFKNN